MEYETLTIAELTDLTLTVNTYLEGSGQDGKSGKFTVNQLSAILAPLIASVGASGYLPTTGTVLPSGTGTNFTFIKGPATYTQSAGGNITTSQFLNIASRTGSVWSLTLEIPIDFSLYVKKTNIALNEKGQYVQNLVDITSASIMANTTINNQGDIVAFNDANLSYRIPVTEGASYYLGGTTDSYGRTIRYEDANNAKVGFLTINTYPYTLTIPTGLGIKFILFPTKLATIAQYPTSMTLVVPSVSAQSLKEVQYLAAGIIDVNSPSILANKSLDNNGNIVTQNDAKVSYPLIVQPSKSYIVTSEVSDSYARAVQFQDATGAKIGFVMVSGMPFKFSTPANTRSVIFNTKLATIDQANIFLNEDVGQSSLPWLGKVIDLYGDSISNDYIIYKTLTLSKTGASNVNQRGQSGQSFGQLLQTDSVLAPAKADAADLYLLHCVNDMRGNPDETINIPGSVSSAVGASLDMAGGLKKIITSFITANKNARIVVMSSLTYGDVKGAGFPNSFGSDQPNPAGYYHTDYVKVQRDIAELYGCDFLDLGFKMGIRPQVENNASLRYLTRDGVHPSDAYGYPRMTDIIADYVNSMAL